MVVCEACRGGPRMLSEEGFILVVVGSACVLLVLGILELLWPTKRGTRAPRGSRGAARPADVVTPCGASNDSGAASTDSVRAASPVSHPPEAEPLEAS